MAHQDYVSRPRATNKKNNPYNQQEAASEGVPLKVKLISFFTLIAIAMFGYFLWSIKDNQPAPIHTGTPQSPAKKPSTKSLPAPPKEKWKYMEELKNKEVEVGEYEVKTRGPYQMQCGSFRTQKQAEVLKANIAFTGIEAQIRQVKGSSGTWHKVILGPYERKRLAEKDKHKLKNNNINGCQIWLWR
ncbi:SPOR domain-containing protein [Thalassomonas haliotis]|uniref:SPOR domain-containing protein n=1 Tax=Thalassomonas haliotis TaxID=485448 RepID=A0ABY7VBZ4_9GAMM|nr:SPOR domain-containing protein [Thalassomonas haliotis]WDE11180.1 SPOR domain-containing protein [Thalassomonas haliotis]